MVVRKDDGQPRTLTKLGARHDSKHTSRRRRDRTRQQLYPVSWRCIQRRNAAHRNACLGPSNGNVETPRPSRRNGIPAGEALFAIDDQQSEIAATQTELDAMRAELDANQVYVDELKRMITVSGTRLTLRASRITLDSELTVANGELECDLLTTEAVDSESYTPGAGNVW